jgi:uncharacterized protein
MTTSAIYESVVRHQRFKPMGHRLRYGVYSLLVDLDEIDDLCRSVPILSHNRFNLVSIHDRDFGPRDGSDLRGWFESTVAGAGVSIDGGRVSMLAFPRILGYAFNPITVWFGHDSGGELKAVVYEVHNTFGQAHTYVAAVPDHDSAVRGRLPTHSFDKVFHVSPFFETEGGYRMTLTPPTERYSIVIDYRDADGERLLTASQVGRRRHLTTWTLLKQFFTTPLLTLKVIGGIHAEAIKLWRKGAMYRPVPPPHPGVEVATWDEAGDLRSNSEAA